MVEMHLYDTCVGQKDFFYSNDGFWVSKIMICYYLVSRVVARKFVGCVETPIKKNLKEKEV